MITREEFAEINEEIKASLNYTLELLKNISPKDYVVFLANGEYKESYGVSQLNLNPYAIDDRTDFYKDETRLNFLINFLSANYTFPIVQISTGDNFYQLNIEMMIYCHIWESKPFLKKLYRLAQLINGKEYDWDVKVPDMSKHEFIRNEIRDKFKSASSTISEIITKGFHTSLRNAFAHSEFSIIEEQNTINLHNYKGIDWEIKEITFNDWSKRFVYSALLSYYLLDSTQKNRENLINEFRSNSFVIKHPSKSNGVNNAKIYYHKENDSFGFHQG